jgi:hypothetical protein
MRTFDTGREQPADPSLGPAKGFTRVFPETADIQTGLLWAAAAGDQRQSL